MVILILCCLQLRAQVPAPQLRCLRVLGNGDVAFTWIAPPDPNNSFTAYELWTANAYAGPYTLITNTIGPLSTSTYTHVGAGANISSRFYFMISTSGLNGALRSQPGDTLRTMFLNVQLISGAKDLKLLYYNLRNPPLPSTQSTYTLQKEYPMGSWTSIGVTALNNYADTISVCSASINYQVQIADRLGCVSGSNIIGDIYSDTKDPNEPFVDSVSVLPDGRTILAWRVPYDKDISKYQIQYKTDAGPNATLAIVPGRNNTSYTYSASTTGTAPLGIFVGAIDSCNRVSTLNYNLSSLFLKTAYDSCAYSTALSWNAYQSMPSGVLEYRVYYSEDGVQFKRIGATTALSYTHSGVSPDKTVWYFVRVVNKTQTITASGNRVQFYTKQVPVPSYIYMQTATVLSPNRIRLHVFCDTNSRFSGVDIFRSSDRVNYSPIAFLPYSGARLYAYEDEPVQAGSQSYSYRARLRDACGNARSVSNTCRTMLLKVSNDHDLVFTKHLSWSPYEGFNAGVKRYSIYRVINYQLQVPAIASTNSDVLQYTDNLEDEATAGANIDYMVIAEEKQGNVYGLSSESNSNRCTVYLEGQVFVPNAFAPNGMNRLWLPVTHFVDKFDYHVQVFDRWGELVFETRSDTEGWDGGNAPGGIYAYLITYKNARGEYRDVKGSLLMMR